MEVEEDVNGSKEAVADQGIGVALSPEESIKVLQKKSEIRRNFSEWPSAIHTKHPVARFVWAKEVKAEPTTAIDNQGDEVVKDKANEGDAQGDLNCVFNVDERLGSTVRSWEMEDGRRCMEECGLVNVKQYGQFYTWCNRHDVSSRVYSKLDRVMTNEAWGSIYEDAIGMFLNEDEANIAHSQLIHAQKKLQAIPFVEELISAKRNTHEVYRNKHQVYMSFLRQKAKLQWLTHDDEISSVFHKSIKARRLMNIVYVINDEKGNMKDTLKEVAAAFLDYYQKLLGVKRLECILRATMVEYSLPIDMSWYWKKVYEVRDKTKTAGLQQDISNMQRYYVKSVYLNLIEEQQKVQWAGFVWNRLAVSRHGFCAWLGM
ncbi:putative transferrin-binding protein 1 [Bienertia sinuspersici]